ncbi:hypothetical protein Taro_025139 [Colocasia esculenta]|uniref:Uncharacterized protein n=1 Tax=Colocasia esculenta TaxID=4460 RepID=A0A843VBE7_COLES|nr:hypothetical protein [Colocasia esculenta]
MDMNELDRELPSNSCRHYVDTAWASVDLLSQNSPDGVLGSPLVSTQPHPMSTHSPRSDEEPVESDGTGQE